MAAMDGFNDDSRALNLIFDTLPNAKYMDHNFKRTAASR